MEKVHKILGQLKNGGPCALIRQNDGECRILKDYKATAARGNQPGSRGLQKALRDAILHEQKNYWKGYPCPECFPGLWQFVKESGYYNLGYKFNTMAVVNTNRNLKIFSEGLQEALKGRDVVLVSGEDQDYKELDFNVIKHIKAPLKNAWGKYNELFEECIEVILDNYWKKEGVVFLFSLGPVARVLVKNLFESFSDYTYLDIGDTYSNITRNVWRKCHKGTLKKCRICN